MNINTMDLIYSMKQVEFNGPYETNFQAWRKFHDKFSSFAPIFSRPLSHFLTHTHTLFGPIAQSVRATDS